MRLRVRERSGDDRDGPVFLEFPLDTWHTSRYHCKREGGVRAVFGDEWSVGLPVDGIDT